MSSRFGIINETIKKGALMLKTSFQKLILAIPLRANISAAFAIMLGLAGAFLPLVFLHITMQDSAGTLTNMRISRVDFSARIDMFSCYEYLVLDEISLPPYWISASIWVAIFRFLPLLVGFSYISKHTTKKSMNIASAFIMFFIVLFLVLSVILAPGQINCGPGWKMTITGYSISWLSFFVPILGFLLGCYALLKGNIMKRLETSS